MRLRTSVASALLVGLATVPLRAQMSGVDWNAIAVTLVNRMALTQGERVLLLGVPGQADSLVAPLRDAIARAGGTDLGVMSATLTGVPSWETPFVI